MNEENDVSLEIGKYLEKIRKSAGVELADIAKDTKISLRQLGYLEKSQLDKLPGQAYVAGFVQSYLKFLKTDPQEALAILKEDYVKQTGVAASNPFVENKSEPSSKIDGIDLPEIKLFILKNNSFFLNFITIMYSYPQILNIINIFKCF